jgi:hypothetical protein
MTEADARVIRDIEDVVQGTADIPASLVRKWLSGRPSVEVLGAITEIFANSRRVVPPLTLEEICAATQEYFRLCLIHNLPDSEYAPNRSVAGLELVSWFNSLWRDSSVPREYVVRLVNMLRDLVIKGAVPQDQLAGAVLEHLFETRGVEEFFADWRDDIRLAKAFELAMDWARDH